MSDTIVTTNGTTYQYWRGSSFSTALNSQKSSCGLCLRFPGLPQKLSHVISRRSNRRSEQRFVGQIPEKLLIWKISKPARFQGFIMLGGSGVEFGKIGEHIYQIKNSHTTAKSDEVQTETGSVSVISNAALETRKNFSYLGAISVAYYRAVILPLNIYAPCCHRHVETALVSPEKSFSAEKDLLTVFSLRKQLTPDQLYQSHHLSHVGAFVSGGSRVASSS